MAENHKNKTFGIYASEDIIQEIWIIALQKIGSFDIEKMKVVNDPKKALEHWLNTTISNRLKNLYRDKYLVPQRMIKGKKEKTPNNLMSPVDIQHAMEDNSLKVLENLDTYLLEVVISRLDPALFDILDAMLSGEVIGSYYKSKIYKIVKEVMHDTQETDAAESGE